MTVVAPDPLDLPDYLEWKALIVQFIDGQAFRTPQLRRDALDAVELLAARIEEQAIERDALVEVARAARQVVVGVERDLPEWLADDGEYTVPEFAYFVRLAAALARLDKQAQP